jgi:hypothetical protein
MLKLIIREKSGNAALKTGGTSSLRKQPEHVSEKFMQGETYTFAKIENN